MNQATPADMGADALSGLALPQNLVEPKFFYAAAGSIPSRSRLMPSGCSACVA
jgi:hypothetical protein